MYILDRPNPAHFMEKISLGVVVFGGSMEHRVSTVYDDPYHRGFINPAVSGFVRT